MNPSSWLVPSYWTKTIQVLGLGQALRSKIWGFLIWIWNWKSKFLASVRLLCEIRILGLGYQTLSKPCAINDFCPGPGSHFENMIIFYPWSGSVPENPNFLPWPGPVFENLSFRLPWPGSVFENLSHYCHYKVYVPNSSFCFVLPRPASVFENLIFFLPW